LSNNSRLVNGSKTSIKSGKQLQSPESAYRIVGPDGLDYSSISKDKL